MTSSLKNNGMRSMFHDMEDTSYDVLISDTKKRMENMSHCECEHELQNLIFQMGQILNQFKPRPCNAGWCLGIFTPHRDRIKHRIKSFQAELLLHNEGCKRENAEKDYQRKYEMKMQKLIMEREIAKEKLAYQSQATEIHESKKTKKGVFDKE